ncbi:MAG: PQQ-dependent sugar dehydrogenase [Phycisphaerales bacterium]
MRVFRWTLLPVLILSTLSHAQSVTDLWSNNCKSCHGDRGQGGGAGTRSLLTDELFDQKFDRPFFDAVKLGLPDQGMAAFGETLSDAKIWGLVVHIRELQAKERRDRLGAPKPDNGVYATQHARYRIETVIDTKAGLEAPWSVDFLPDGRMLVADRPGRLRVFDPKSRTLSKPVSGTPAVRNRGQGGLMDVAPHPDFADNGWIYLSFTDELRKDGRSLGFTKVVRGRISPDNTWTDQQTIFHADPSQYSTSDLHFGCRLVFRKVQDHDRHHLFFCIGERGNGPLAQRLDRPNGKVFRVWDDGSIPSDNPFTSDTAAIPAIWSYGHRNPQGLVFDLEGRLWDTEHGPRGGDELNLIRKGRDYGWPSVSFGINYNDAPLVTPWPSGGRDIAMPTDRWIPSIGACGLDVVRGDAFPDWRGDLLAGGLSGANIDRIRLTQGDSPAVLEREEILHGLGRVRDVVCGPEGHIYIALNAPDKIIKLVPAH